MASENYSKYVQMVNPSLDASNSALDQHTNFGQSTAIDWFTGQMGAKEQATRQSYLDTQEYLRNQSSAREQRAWEEYMDSTKTQRAMKDIEAAGLNPWLALQSAGFGGSTPSGASSSSSAGQVASSGSSSGLTSIGTTALGLAALIKTIAKIVSK